MSSKKRSLTRYVVIFVLAQVAWFSLLGLWIYRFISSRMILKQVDESLSSWIMSEGANIFTLVLGCVLFLGISIGMSLIFRNFTVQYKMTTLYDNFIANITHELKTPLASIQLNLETIKNRALPRKQQEKFVDLMLKDAERLQRLVNTILEIAGMEQKKAGYECGVFKAGEVMRELIQDSREQFKLQENAVSVSGHADCDCVIDKNSFRILIDNLMDNAIKFSPEGKKVQVIARKDFQVDEDRIEVLVRDQGSGISRQNLKRIFEKFWQAPKEEGKKRKGIGLGLALVKKIIDQHNCQIRVESTPGKGTTFFFTLPVYSKTGSEPGQEPDRDED